MKSTTSCCAIAARRIRLHPCRTCGSGFSPLRCSLRRCTSFLIFPLFFFLNFSLISYKHRHDLTRPAKISKHSTHRRTTPFFAFGLSLSQQDLFLSFYPCALRSCVCFCFLVLPFACCFLLLFLEICCFLFYPVLLACVAGTCVCCCWLCDPFDESLMPLMLMQLEGVLRVQQGPGTIR